MWLTDYPPLHPQKCPPGGEDQAIPPTNMRSGTTGAASSVRWSRPGPCRCLRTAMASITVGKEVLL
jgi:hypothetical protein